MACTPVLLLTVRGGLSNQKECVLNGAIAAQRLGMTLALPHLDLIGAGNEPFEPRNATYVAPYSDRSKWGHFNHLFNASRAVARLQGQLPVITRLRGAADKERPPTVTLPSIETVVPDCGGQPRVHNTCEARPHDTRMFEQLLASWAPLVRARCGAAATASKRGAALPRILFDAGQSLCWNAYKSRFADSCRTQYPMCAAMLHALTWNRVISRLHMRTLRGLQRKIARASSERRAAASWAAVHVRAFICNRDGRQPSFKHVKQALRRHGFTSGILYLVSSLPLAQLQRALPEYELVSKTTFLGDEMANSYPFEVCAAIDYGIAVRAPLYVGEPLQSSFDAFAAEERRRHNLSDIVTLPRGACERAA